MLMLNYCNVRPALFAASDTVSRGRLAMHSIKKSKHRTNFFRECKDSVIPLLFVKQELNKHIKKNSIRRVFLIIISIPRTNAIFYTSIIYIEPFEGRNLRAFGYDMFTEAIRRKALETARDSNTVMLTPKSCF